MVHIPETQQSFLVSQTWLGCRIWTEAGRVCRPVLESIPQAASCLGVFSVPHEVSKQTVKWHCGLTQQDTRRTVGVLGAQLSIVNPLASRQTLSVGVRGVGDGSMAQWLSTYHTRVQPRTSVWIPRKPHM